MPGSAHRTPSPPSRIDLSEVTEATRRALYDATVERHFAVPPGTEDYMPFYDADQAGLSVWHCVGRWFACWKALEETDNTKLPPDTKWQLLRIIEDPEAPHGVHFHEV
jgi:hypothetical protein